VRPAIYELRGETHHTIKLEVTRNTERMGRNEGIRGENGDLREAQQSKLKRNLKFFSVPRYRTLSTESSVLDIACFLPITKSTIFKG